jgi:hypothetical protein
MKRILLILVAAVASAQTSRYPGALDTDSSLFVLRDNVQTTLSSSMSTGDSTMTVANAAGFVANMIVTICDTSTNTGKCTAWEHMLVTAPPVGNTITVTRAFAGTSARSHSSGKLVSALIDSAHQEVLKSAVVQIQTALGPNLQNASSSFAASNYNFTAQSPGGSLIAGNNAVTFTPVPAGVNGSDYNHYLWVTGGTGTSESCLINGGSGTAGQASGQVFLNCAFTHSGAWTVSSTAGGFPEAIQAASTAGGGTVVINNAITANFTANGSTLVGSYPAAATINSPNINVSCPSLANGLFPSSTFSQSADLLLIQPTTNPIFGMNVNGCSFRPLSPGTAGRYMLHVQLLGAPTQFTSQFAFFNITGNRFGYFDGSNYFQAGTSAVYLDNTADNLNGIYAGNLSQSNVITGGLKTTNLGDSVTIADNRFHGDGPGIRLHESQFGAGLGASQNIISRNNFWVRSSAPIVVEQGSRIQISDNNIETSNTATGSNDAMVDIQGTALRPVFDIWITRNLFSMQENGSGVALYHYGLRFDRVQGIRLDQNVWGGAVATQAGIVCTANAGDIYAAAWSQSEYSLVPAKLAYAGCTKVNTQFLMGAGVSAPYALGGIYATGYNFLGPTSGANNAISTPGGSATEAPIGPPLTGGTCVTVFLAHTLQAGANTFAYRGGPAVAIKSHNNGADIAAAYVVGGMANLCYNGTIWLDMSQ